MFQVIARDSLSELLKAAPDSDAVRAWTGYLLWAAALSGGIFGLLGGWLVDKFGRKTVMIGSIMVYSFAPVMAALSRDIPFLDLYIPNSCACMFGFFRCATFVGVCVEFVAAVTWLSELFPDKRKRELVIGWTLAVSSLGGIFVTEVFNFIGDHRQSFPAFPVGADPHATWRYSLLTGLIPGLMIAVLLPFVPESRVWQDRKRAGTLGRPSFLALFSRDMARTTLVATVLSACAYAAAFGALQLTPSQIAVGLPEFTKKQAAVSKEIAGLDQQHSAMMAEIGALDLKIVLAKPDSDEQKELIAQRKAKENEPIAERKAKENERKINAKERIGTTQRWQELGGLLGRIVLAILLIFVASRRTLLRMFQIPGLIVLPLTYFYFFSKQPDYFMAIYFFAGLFTIAQFS